MNATALDVRLDERELAEMLRADARAGLTAIPKRLPPKWFYDARGIDLFEQITRLPEYYPTRAERLILSTHADQIAGTTSARTLIELGSGSAEKTRLLLDALRRHGTLAEFVPLDVCEPALREAIAAIAADYPGLAVHAIADDFTRHRGTLPRSGRRLVAFLGGTVGNLEPAQRAEFLAGLRSWLEPGEWLLLGADLVKDPSVLVPAYDDAAGVTAEFNRNLLRVLNRELGATFDVDAFVHVALWDPDQEWIEMRLRSTEAARVELAAIGLTVDFVEGEELRTEVSAKFHREGLTRELAMAGFRIRHWWTDPARQYSVSLARVQ
jgi:L-histidine N-alpha-methyltransferase